MQVKQTYTVNEAARRIGVSADTIKAWIKRGKLRGWKTSDEPQGRWLIPAADIDAIAQGNRAS